MSDTKLESYREEEITVKLESAEVANTNVPTLSAEEERKLYRKIDIRLLPSLSLMYLWGFVDRGNIGNAKLAGLATQLKLSSNEYTIALIMFFIPFCVFEPASNLLVKRVRPSRYLPALTFAFGVITTLMGIVKTYPQLVVARVFLGAAEAGLFPGVVYFLTFWYPRHMLQLRVGLFFGAATVAGAFTGLLAYGISFMEGTAGLEGWSWIFILEGIATVAIAILGVFALQGCDGPEVAGFLTPEERAFISQRQKFGTRKVAEDDSYKHEYVIGAATDWQVWISALTYLSLICPIYACALFLPSIIHGFGYSQTISQLLTVPPYAVATIVLITSAYYSDKLKLRSPFIFAGQCLAVVGYIINITNAPRGVKYFGMFLCTTGAYSGFPGVIAWLGNNLAPTYKRGIGMAIQIGIGHFGGAISSSVFRSKDQPRYFLGNAVEIGFLVMGLVTVPLTALTYKHINASREAARREGEYSDGDLARMGDRAPDFRYFI